VLANLPATLGVDRFSAARFTDVESRRASDPGTLISFRVWQSWFDGDGRIQENLSRRHATVDKIEEARSREFNKVPQRSTSYPHLIETEAAENRALARAPGIRLGRRCAPFWRIFRFNN
jgi:hypothetical protein